MPFAAEDDTLGPGTSPLVAAYVQRYLKQEFEKRVLPGLKGGYHGPKKVKSSGKAVGVKKKKNTAKGGAKKKAAKKPNRPRSAPSKPAVFSDDGHAPLRKKQP